MAAKVTRGDGAANSSRSEATGTSGDPKRTRRRALVITVSDGVAAGIRQDLSGEGLARRLEEIGFLVNRTMVPDEEQKIEKVLLVGARRHHLILTTGGTGLTPRDLTPQATQAVIEFEVPGLSELMRAEGGRSTPYAYLSRAVAGVLERCLIVNLPGSPRGALESLAALEPILDHALATLAGPFDHDQQFGDRATGIPRADDATPHP